MNKKQILKLKLKEAENKKMARENKYIELAYQRMIINLDIKEIPSQDGFVDIFRFLNDIGIFITTYETYELFKNSFDKYIIKDIYNSMLSNNKNCLDLLISNNYLTKEEVSDFIMFLGYYLFSNKNEIILDPFIGLGLMGVAEN